MTKSNIAIIGAGNMGSCLLGGLIANDYPAENLWIANPSIEKLISLQQQFKKNFHITTDNVEAIKTADIIILAVKPLVLPKVVQQLATAIEQHKPLVISTAAGVHEAIVQHYLKGEIPIVRAMPNIPAIIGCGATALFANPHVSGSQRSIAESIFRAVGVAVWIEDEKLMDAITAVSGCGPAYFFLVMEAIQSAGEKLGLPSTVARLFTLETAYGAARMALESDKNTMELRKQVASPGGTTEQALRVLEEAKIRDIFADALQAANNRAKELAEILAKKMES